MKDYNPAFDVMMDCLSSNDQSTKTKLEKYIVHRSLYGREASRRMYPECYYIQISDPVLRNVWDSYLKTLDKMKKNAR